MAIKTTLYHGEVIKADDAGSHRSEKERGKVQVRILPELKDVETTLLPWADPIVMGGMSSSSFSKTAYNAGDKVYLLDMYDDNFKQLKIIAGAFVKGMFDFSKVKTSLDNISDIAVGDYKNITFNYTADGSIFFNNILTGAMGIYHKSGNYTVFGPDGKIYIKGEEVAIISNTSVTLEAKEVIFKVPGGSLFKPSTMIRDPFSGADHSLITTIKGETAV